MAPTIEPGSLQEGQGARKKWMEASKDVSRPCFRRPLGSPKAIQTHRGSNSKTELHSNVLQEEFWGVSESDLKGFLNPLLDGLMCKRGNRYEERIFKKHSCVFTVRLHAGPVDFASLKLARVSSFCTSE